MPAAALSVVVPTHRPLDLAPTLQALAAQTVQGFEVLLVENGEASAVVAEARSQWQRRLPLRWLHDPRAGLNRARNRGVAEARGEIIALVDDDCRPAPDWAEQLLAAHARHADAGVIGGRVLLAFDQPPPSWLLGEFRGSLSELDWGDACAEIAEGQYLVGANISFRRAVHARAGGFPEALGMSTRASPQLANDEIGFFDGVRRIASPALLYEPRIRVHHRIPDTRVTLAWMFQRRFGQGVSDIALAALRRPGDHATLVERFANAACPHAWHARQVEQRLRDVDADTAAAYLYAHVIGRIGYLLGLVEGLRDHAVTAGDEGWIDADAVAAGWQQARHAANADTARDHVVRLMVDTLYAEEADDAARPARARRRLGLLVGMLQCLAGLADPGIELARWIPREVPAIGEPARPG